MKAQIISMDFIMTFVVYLFALSIFFFALKDVVSGEPRIEAKTQDIFTKFTSSELLFNKLSNVYDEDYGFLRASRINDSFDTLMAKYDPDIGYELYFKIFEDSDFARIDYCIFIEDAATGDIIRNFAAFDSAVSDNSIYFGDERCGTSKQATYTDIVPRCSLVNADTLALSKPVLFEDSIVNLKVIICAEKR